MKFGNIIKKKDFRRGFTLIELMIVLAIIAVLALWAINGYSQYRRLALLDLMVDNTVSQIYELRDKVVFGESGSGKFDLIMEELAREDEGTDFMDFGGELVGQPDFGGELVGQPDLGAFLDSEDFTQEHDIRCYGFYFEKSLDEGFDLKKFYQGFNPKKVWNEFLGEWDIVGCDDFRNRVDLDFEKDESVYFLSDQDLSVYVIRFYPPYGKVQVSVDGGLSFEFAEELDLSITFDLRYGKSDEEIYKRQIEFNPKAFL